MCKYGIKCLIFKNIFYSKLYTSCMYNMYVQHICTCYSDSGIHSDTHTYGETNLYKVKLYISWLHGHFNMVTLKHIEHSL